jgi:hypothetical protein
MHGTKIWLHAESATASLVVGFLGTGRLGLWIELSSCQEMAAGNLSRRGCFGTAASDGHVCLLAIEMGWWVEAEAAQLGFHLSNEVVPALTQDR